ncbi:MAG: 7-cyano-7-deazaguanine synthase QueC [Legionellales bacterium RIFCSPHIGHO2_12_FULL_37_14]|nr:MAG: 7-cyano-7-deazaguanine synthase QueC [Legionellales bacterium RIFCSPHIGHO2_12_FULL_37_14]
MQKAVVLFSGGLDSTTCLAIAKEAGYIVHALSFSYGQRHAVELKHAKVLAKKLGVDCHKVIKLDIAVFANSLLTQKASKLPQFNPRDQIAPTYVPARNTVFLAYALAYAELIDAAAIYIGVSQVDYSGYPDCRAEFIAAFQELANLATKKTVCNGKIAIKAPLINLSKAETIKLGIKLKINYQATVSCYQANAKGEACGVCDSCGLRKAGFKAAKVLDPTRYYSFSG